MPKIVDKYILRTFIPLFVMSFAVCWFIVVMQFLWRYIDELVGKGLSGFMLLKIIFYAALSFIPMSLPLGILLASLMTLGNLGERLELLALKASGIRLYPHHPPHHAPRRGDGMRALLLPKRSDDPCPGPYVDLGHHS